MTAGLADAVGDHPAVVVSGAPQVDQEVAVGDERRADENRGPGHDLPGLELDTGHMVGVVDDEPGDRALDHADGAGDKLFAFFVGQAAGVGEKHDVGRPLPDDERVHDRLRGAAEDADGLVADLVAVAVRAVKQITTPPFAQTFDVGDVVAQPGGDQDAAGEQRPAVGEGHLEPVPVAAGDGPKVGDGAGDELASVAGDLVPALLEQGGRWGAVPAEEAVHVRGRGVTRFSGVDDSDPAPGAGEDQGG